eukprot:1855229-Amphidinium_carterae.1
MKEFGSVVIRCNNFRRNRIRKGRKEHEIAYLGKRSLKFCHQSSTMYYKNRYYATPLVSELHWPQGFKVTLIAGDSGVYESRTT